MEKSTFQTEMPPKSPANSGLTVCVELKIVLNYKLIQALSPVQDL